MNQFEAAEKLLRGELSVEEYQQIPAGTDLQEAVRYLARERVKAVTMDHVWYVTSYGDTWIKIFETHTGVHLGPVCSRCGYRQCVVCQAVSAGREWGEKCSGEGSYVEV